MTFNQEKFRQAKEAGVVKSHDEEAKPATAMTPAEVNAANRQYWGYPTGDEVSPTQSDPPDSRSDNLMEPGAKVPVYGGTDGFDGVSGGVYDAPEKSDEKASMDPEEGKAKGKPTDADEKIRALTHGSQDKECL